MGLFSRLGDIINSNINAMLDSAENPEKIARLIIQEMEDTLVEVRTAAARAMADKKEMEREIAHFSATRDEWAAKAELAIDKGREDLARGALVAKQKAEGEIDRRKVAMDAAEEAFEKRQDDLAKLQAKLDEAKAKHRALMMRREAAEQRIRIRSQVYDGKVDDALARYNNIERKVDEMEAYADTIKGREPSLEAEFAALERDESVEKELEALKAKRAKSSAKSSSKKSEE
ncbi:MULTISPECIES: phage shock protein PspA [Hyphomonas]|jgi:phage shock protein A|uniref:Phage-shock protein n=1 Tax=Hyphomonas atlantica TaxID=1280948 RepID=A0A059DY97_9PROT|nr:MULTISPECIES: phage shock protein PspA [Hyphomonas]KCZ58522.1 phage-shock protein [Hyphomonas atlantica]MAH93080.1 phage shock protein PspA [Hyphomonas sp.]OUX86489.1 MAG: phage shock protein PspA [Hyphomonas sp. TMED31]HBH44880.1 phage shock protein PspA [Hyphomonas atlantica]|tara:strand:- start:601 stop:1293 length:693 start_codon:yes stop_codon:yes gene_type:complete